MEHYGDYEVVKEIPAIESAVFTTYTARKIGSSAVAYVIRIFRPLDAVISVPAGEVDSESLPEGQLTTYIQGVKQQQKASKAGAKYIAPVHALGIDPRGAWYVTDYYPRGTLKRLIQGQYQVDQADLYHVIYSIVRGLREMKVHAGRSHGNLNSNLILISGKKGKRLCHAQLFVSDPLPGDHDKKDTFEIADLHSTGEIIYQLIRRREVSGVANWPIPHSEDWSALEQFAEGWRELCNSLLDPNLSLETFNFEKLETTILQLRPKQSVSLPVYGVISVILFLCGFIAFLRFANHSAIPGFLKGIAKSIGNAAIEQAEISNEEKTADQTHTDKGSSREDAKRLETDSQKEAKVEIGAQSKIGEEQRETEQLARAEEERRRHAEEEEKRLQEEARLKAEEKQRAQREAEEKARFEAEKRARAEAEAKRIAEEKQRAEEEARLKAEAEERAKREAEERARFEAEQQARAEAEARRKEAERLRAEEEARKKAEAARLAQLEAEEKARREAEEKARIDEEKRLQAEAEAKRIAEEKKRVEEEARLKAEIAKFATNFEITNSVGMLLVKVPEGYWVSKYETTQAEYKKIMGVNPSTVQGEKLPVDGISFQDALEFCRLLTERDKDRLPRGFQYSVPTEKQWLSFVSDARIQDSITSKDRPAKRVQPEEVGSTGIANQFGLFDVRGNVWEWCFNDDPENRPVLKGGAFDGRIEHGPLGNLSLTYRFLKNPDSPTPAAGIRLILIQKL